MKRLLNPWRGLEGYNCFGCSPDNPSGVRMEFYEDGDEIVSVWHPRPDFQGWLNTLHGGIQSVLLDEICAWVVIRKLNTSGVTSRMATRYRKAISTTDDYLLLRAHIVSHRHNLVEIEAAIYNQAGEVCAEATCQYFAYPPEKAQSLFFFRPCETVGDDVTLEDVIKRHTISH